MATSGVNFMINVAARMPGARATNNSLATLEKRLGDATRATRKLEQQQRRLNKAGKLGSQQFLEVTQAKAVAQNRLARLTSDYARRMLAGEEDATAGASGLLSKLGEVSPRLGGIISRFGALGSTGVIAFAGLAVAAVAVVAVVAKIAGAVARVAAKLVRVGIATAAWAEKTRMALGLLLKSDKAGAVAFTHIARLAAELGLNVQETTGQFKKLLAMQFKVGEATDIIKLAADMKALGASALEVQSIIRAIGQIKGKGVLQMEELQQQLAETGISVKLVIDALAKSLGKSSTEIRKLISAGKISADQGIAAIKQAVLQKMHIAKLGDAARKAGNTLTGLWERMKGQWELLKIQLGNELLPLLQKQLAPAFRRLLKWMKTPAAAKAFQKIVAVVKILVNWFSTAVRMIGGFIEGLGNGLAQGEALGATVGQFDAASIQKLVAAAVKFGEAVGKAISKVLALVDALHRVPGIDFATGPLQGGGLQAGGQKAGGSLALGLAAGIANHAGVAIAAATSLASKVSAAVGDVLQIGSPSKLMEQYGRWTAEGFGSGVEAAAPAAQKPMAALVAPSTAPGGGRGQAGPVTIYVTATDGEDVAKKIRAALVQITEGVTIELGAGPAPEGAT